MEYHAVPLENKYMWHAYHVAKMYYMQSRWNDRQSPVAVLVEKASGKIIHTVIAARGAHYIFEKCDRLKAHDMPYEACDLCKEYQHAEALLAKDLSSRSFKGHVVYIYGQWHCCANCEKILKRKGVEKVFIMENAKALFSRASATTVIGSPKQFQY